jgi:hypothetical protein
MLRNWETENKENIDLETVTGGGLKGYNIHVVHVCMNSMYPT